MTSFLAGVGCCEVLQGGYRTDGVYVMKALDIRNELRNVPEADKDGAVNYVISRSCRNQETIELCVRCKWCGYFGPQDNYKAGISVLAYIGEANRRFKPT